MRRVLALYLLAVVVVGPRLTVRGVSTNASARSGWRATAVEEGATGVPESMVRAGIVDTPGLAMVLVDPRPNQCRFLTRRVVDRATPARDRTLAWKGWTRPDSTQVRPRSWNRMHGYLDFRRIICGYWRAERRGQTRCRVGLCQRARSRCSLSTSRHGPLWP